LQNGNSDKKNKRKQAKDEEDHESNKDSSLMELVAPVK